MNFREAMKLLSYLLYNEIPHNIFITRGRDVSDVSRDHGIEPNGTEGASTASNHTKDENYVHREGELYNVVRLCVWGRESTTGKYACCRMWVRKQGTRFLKYLLIWVWTGLSVIIIIITDKPVQTQQINGVSCRLSVFVAYPIYIYLHYGWRFMGLAHKANTFL